MAHIKIADLQTADAGVFYEPDLFDNSESYIRELSDAEIAVQGGGLWDIIKDAAKWGADRISLNFTDGGVIVSYGGSF